MSSFDDPAERGSLLRKVDIDISEPPQEKELIQPSQSQSNVMDLICELIKINDNPYQDVRDMKLFTFFYKITNISSWLVKQNCASIFYRRLLNAERLGWIHARYFIETIFDTHGYVYDQ